MSDSEKLDKIIAFCKERKLHYNREMDSITSIVRMGGPSIGMGSAQHAWRAYESILEIIDGQEPCDKPFVDE